MTKITKKSKLFKKLAKKNGWKVKEIKLKKGDPADLRGLPKFDLAGWNKACEAVFAAAEKEGIPTPRTAEQIMDEFCGPDTEVVKSAYEHITNRLHPTLANRKPWPTWPVVEATDELHREFLSKKDSDKVHEIAERLYDIVQRAEAHLGRRHPVSDDLHNLLDIIERS